jgi:hypothetical protein
MLAFQILGDCAEFAFSTIMKAAHALTTRSRTAFLFVGLVGLVGLVGCAGTDDFEDERGCEDLAAMTADICHCVSKSPMVTAALVSSCSEAPERCNDTVLRACSWSH